MAPELCGLERRLLCGIDNRAQHRLDVAKEMGGTR